MGKWEHYSNNLIKILTKKIEKRMRNQVESEEYTRKRAEMFTEHFFCCNYSAIQIADFFRENNCYICEKKETFYEN